MPFSLDSGPGGPDLGAFHRGPQRLDDRLNLLGTPHDEYSH
jgi:hypothetical protein